MRTRITEMLGIDIPVVQAPMSYIARAKLASAVSNAGGMGIIETTSGQIDDIKAEIAKTRDLDRLKDQYFGGQVDVAVPFGGQVMGRIDEVPPVADILRGAWDDCQLRLRRSGQAAG